MLRSMTGYGRGESKAGENTIIAEVKSVNNRFRDIVVRLPRALQPLEDDIRSRVGSRIRRGRIEVSIQMEKKEGQAEYALDLNLPLAKSYYRILTTVCDEFKLEKAIRPEEICQMKDVVCYRPEELNPEEIRQSLASAVESALEACDSMRVQEGRALEAELEGRLTRIEAHLDEIERSASQVLDVWKRKTRERIQQLLQGVEVDEGRLAQEIVFFADRSDITEEVVRIRSHLVQFRRAISGDESVGRKLDFLVQELHREINTIGSKASDAGISSEAVEVKVELEKMREQVQNVE
jgi:uncharacterized protein (TIGR00255 family)